MAKISENIVSLWEIAKNDSPVYRKEREREFVFLATNKDSKGLLFGSHLQMYWRPGSADTYKTVFNPLRNFLDFHKSRNEPANEWDFGPFLGFFEHRRSILIGGYDLRVRKGGGKFYKNR